MMRALWTRSVAVLIGLAPLVARAQGGLIGVPPPAGTAQGDLATVILRLINYVLAIVGVIALAYLVYGGFMYITSAGEEDKVDSAKRILTNAIVGIIVIGIAAALVNFVIRGVGGQAPVGAI